MDLVEDLLDKFIFVNERAYVNNRILCTSIDESRLKRLCYIVHALDLFKKIISSVTIATDKNKTVAGHFVRSQTKVNRSHARFTDFIPRIIRNG